MSDNNKFDTGPWKVRAGVNEFFIDAPPIVCLAVVNSLVTTPKAVARAKANARLIAAAPELLAALESALDGVKYYDEHEGAGETLKEVENAIAKAKGALPAASGS